MKKLTHYVIIITTLLSLLVGCSNNSLDAETLKKLSVEYKYMENDETLIVEPTGDYDPDSYYSDNTSFIAEIVPLEYSFYHVLYTMDNNRRYIDGYAECRCKILNMSQKYNSPKYSEKEIIIRQKIYLNPRDESSPSIVEMYKSMGAYKGGDTVIEGTYRVPDKFINADDFSLDIHEYGAIVLPIGQSMYALIKLDEENPRIGSYYIDSYEFGDRVPDQIPAIMADLKRFLEANDPELFE